MKSSYAAGTAIYLNPAILHGQEFPQLVNFALWRQNSYCKVE